MEQNEITIKANKGKETERTGTFTVSMPASLAEALEHWGEDIVFSFVQSRADAAIGSFVRGLLEGGKSDLDIQAAVDGWKPGARAARGEGITSKVNSLVKHADKLSDEDLASLMAILSARGLV
jgi:hypothetical protein